LPVSRITLKNFTVFDDVQINFSSGINVFIGENGTGKTHLLKAIYGISEISKTKNIDDISLYFKSGNKDDRFFVSQRKPLFAELIVNGVENEDRGAYPMGTFHLKYSISYPSEKVNSVFIPAKDMLTHSNGLLSMAKKYRDMPFDKTLTDIIEKSQQWKLDKVPDIARNVAPLLEKIIGGTITVENDTFYVQKSDGSKVEFGLEAEGIKKFGVLWQLLMNENITRNTVLIWDEPEANINPSLMPSLVEILLELQRNGVQIMVSTHDYVFAKYFEVRRKKGDNVKFHSLYKSNNGIKCESNENFKDLKENPIMKAFDLLLDEVYDLSYGD
jgi:AAA15 family ATPase/GTPase